MNTPPIYTIAPEPAIRGSFRVLHGTEANGEPIIIAVFLGPAAEANALDYAAARNRGHLKILKGGKVA